MTVIRIAFVVALIASSACGHSPIVNAVYSGITPTETRELLRLDSDFDGNGAIDVRTYMRRGRPARLEGDSNGDGFVDRWEYYDANGELLRVGGSTRDDGREDRWVSRAGRETRIGYSTARDGVIDRREVFVNDVLVRTERDTNADGLADTWEQLESGRVATLLIDEDRRSGRPTRRLIYEKTGVRVEVDPDGDGRFVRDEAQR